MDRIIVRRDTYFDSVVLMSASAQLAQTEGLEAGQIALATPPNRELLAAQGFDLSSYPDLGPTDLITALRAPSPQVLDAAEKRVDTLLKTRGVGAQPQDEQRPVGLAGALRASPESNLVVISVPGAYAAYEAQKALAADLHVMIFSDNVGVEDEVALKDEAIRRGLLLMGPDCGTAILNGAMLGFANKVRRGPIGIVGASGTGTQEVTCLIDRAGSGISQAIGTGGRDLKASVEARTTLFAIDALAADPDTRVILVVSKPPAPAVAKRVLDRLASVGKPVVVQFVGSALQETRGNVVHAPDLESAAWAAVDLASGAEPAARRLPRYPEGRLAAEVAGKTPTQRAIRGLFTGGTMAAEALAVMTRAFGAVASNLSHDGLDPAQATSDAHVVLDLGGDEFTQGRPHPMIDPTPRVERLMQEADNAGLAVVLLDVVLGTGSHADPAGAMLPAIEHAKARAAIRGQALSVVASVTGTEGDTQGLAGQVSKLEKAGVVVCPSNIQAVRFACAIVEAQHG